MNQEMVTAEPAPRPLRRIHMSLSVRGALNWPARILNPMAKDNGMSPEEFRDWLMGELSLGREVLPMFECDGFSYKTGCPGHDCDGQEMKS